MIGEPERRAPIRACSSLIAQRRCRITSKVTGSSPSTKAGPPGPGLSVVLVAAISSPSSLSFASSPRPAAARLRPDLASRLDDQLQLRPLLLGRQVVALDRGREP